MMEALALSSTDYARTMSVADPYQGSVLDLDAPVSNSSPLIDPNDPSLILITQNPQPSAFPALVTSNPSGPTPTGILDSIEDFFGDAADATGRALEKTVSTVYSGVKTVASDVESGAEKVVGFGVNQVLLLAVGAAVLIYVAGKAGAFKAIAKAL
jgi:hypothetical protein